MYQRNAQGVKGLVYAMQDRATLAGITAVLWAPGPAKRNPAPLGRRV